MAGSWNFSRVETFLDNLGVSIIKTDPQQNLIVASDTANGIVNMLFDCAGTVLIMEQIISMVPNTNQEFFFKRLLQMNHLIAHGGFAVDQNARVVLFRATHQFEGITKQMIEASLRGLEQAIAQFGPELAGFH